MGRIITDCWNLDRTGFADVDAVRIDLDEHGGLVASSIECAERVLSAIREPIAEPLCGFCGTSDTEHHICSRLRPER